MEAMTPYDETLALLRLGRQNERQARRLRELRTVHYGAAAEAEADFRRDLEREQLKITQSDKLHGPTRFRAMDERLRHLRTPEGQEEWREAARADGRRKAELAHLDALEREALHAAVESVKGEFTVKRLELVQQWRKADKR